MRVGERHNKQPHVGHFLVSDGALTEIRNDHLLAQNKGGYPCFTKQVWLTHTYLLLYLCCQCNC